MRVLLLNPPGKATYIRDYFCSKTSKSNYVFHPVDLLALSGIVGEQHEVEVLDCIAERLSRNEAQMRIINLDPEAIVSLVGSVSWHEDRSFLAQQAREGRRILAIGDVLHENATQRLEEEPWLDAALDDFTSEDVLHILAGNLQDVCRATMRMPDGAIVARNKRNKQRSFRLPRPRHELFPRHGYHFSFARRARFATVLTDYGCPYPCTFCVIGTLGFRTRPVADVLEELDVLRRDGVCEVFFMDQTFGVQRERALELCAALEARGDLSWTAFTRPDLADDELLTAMARAGCHTLIMGVESASYEVLQAYRKGYDSNSVSAAFRRAREHGIRTVGTFIIGLPEETRASLEATLELAKDLKLDFMSLNMAVPRFGTEFRARAISAGFVESDALVMDQGGGDAVLENGTLDPETMLALKKSLVRRFYARPSYLWQRLRSIQSLPELLRQTREGAALFLRNV